MKKIISLALLLLFPAIAGAQTSTKGIAFVNQASNPCAAGTSCDYAMSTNRTNLCTAADGATAIAQKIQTSTTWSNAAARLLSLVNNVTEKFYVLATGDLYTAGMVLENTPGFGSPMVRGQATNGFMSFTSDGVGANWGGTGITAKQDSGTPANSAVRLTVNDTVEGQFGVGFLSINNLASLVSTALTITANTVTPTQLLHSIGAGLVKTINLTPGAPTGSGVLFIIPTAAFTWDATGNIGVAGTAATNQLLVFVWNGTKWWPSYTNGSASFGNFSFSANAVDLTGAAAMSIAPTTANAITLGQTTTLAANKNLLMTAGTGQADFSNGTGVFKTTTGANSFMGSTNTFDNSIRIADNHYLIVGQGGVGGVFDSTLTFGIELGLSGTYAVAFYGGSVIPVANLSARNGDATHLWFETYTNHLVGGQLAVPTCTPGTGAGTSGGPTCSILAHGTDLSGILRITTATTPAGSGATIATISLSAAQNHAPFCNLSAANSAAALIDLTVAVYVDYASGNTGSWVVKNPSATGLTGSTTYDFSYTCTDSSL